VLCPWAITLPATTATHPCRIATTEFAASLAAAEINCWSLMLIDVVMVMGIIQILILVCFNFKSIFYKNLFKIYLKAYSYNTYNHDTRDKATRF
jgi:hypothetical protein